MEGNEWVICVVEKRGDEAKSGGRHLDRWRKLALVPSPMQSHRCRTLSVSRGGGDHGRRRGWRPWTDVGVNMDIGDDAVKMSVLIKWVNS